MGTNKRYADSIDERAAARRQQPADERARLRTDAPPEPRPQARAPQAALRDWQPPWPPIRVAEAEWVLMRESKSDPAAVVRVVRMGPRNESFYRVVTWAPTSEGRTLVGYYTTLAEADRAVLFTPGNVTPK